MGKTMLKFFTFISFWTFYFSAQAQKAAYFQDRTADLNKYTYFYMGNATLDAHELTDPFIKKSELKDNEIIDFIAYNELSLKNLTLIDGKSNIGTLCFNFYQGSAFDEKPILPIGYKKKKLKGNFLILDVLDEGNHQLVWRGWMDFKKLKGAKTMNTYTLYQKAICLILLNFKINPTVIE
jgi:hypothetical protein